MSIDLKHIQTEIDASYLYGVLADAEKDPKVAKVFLEMSDIERGHALAFLEKNGLGNQPMPGPSSRAKVLRQIGKVLGNDYVLGVLMDTEKGLASSIQSARKSTQTQASVSDTAHVQILRNILANHKDLGGSSLARFEKRHHSVGGNALRAAVMGGNDGLVSNFSLVMGVAGASAGQTQVMLTGIAGLLAGALSMSLGEWISVQSSKELSENQMELEMEELVHNPEGEEREIALIYMAKGVDEDQAKAMAKELMKDKSQAHELLIKEELGIHAEDLEGSAMEAAITSFILFALGALIPVFPFFFMGGSKAILASAGLSALGLFGFGSAITLFTGKSVWFSGTRQVLFGLMAAGITFAIGRLIGVSLA